MRRFGAVVVLSAAALCAAAVTAAGASHPVPGNPTPPPSDDTSRQYRGHYLEPRSDSRSAADQCTRPLSRRHGGWACPAPGGVSTIRAFPAEETNAADTAGPCSVAGCWKRFGITHVEFKGKGFYGNGVSQIGEVTFFVTIRMRGAQSLSKPVRFTSSAATSQMVFEGERLYLSESHKAGKPVQLKDGSSSHGITLSGPHAPGQPVTWEPNGYKSYETTAERATIVTEFNWNDPVYPGPWYFYVKSPALTRNSAADRYDFHSATDLPESWYGSGHQPT
jgi:hypothetical protein